MKRLLTYRLMLMLTLLAGLFVVPACQDDLPDTTEVMMTFTTRAVTQGAASTAPDNERMQELHVIMLRSDGTVVGNHTEPNITASSVTFTFSTPIQTTGEDFTFLAIANESVIGQTLTIGDKLSTTDIEKLTMNADLNTIGALPQTKLWTVHVPQTQNHHVNQTLDFVGSKISVQFVNQTGEAQSLSDIKLTGMPQATAGYLFKQNSNDFVTPLQDASDIAFTNVTMETGATSAEQAYYTYPVAAISEAALVATWNGKPYELPLDGITRLARNEHLQIVVTLTPAQDITVNYTVAEWKDNNTNIGDEPPTTPGNGYHVDPWGDAFDIPIGGGGGQKWDVGNGNSITGEDAGAGWEQKINAGGNDILQLELPNDKAIDEYEGYYIYIEFKCERDNGLAAKDPNFKFDIWFMTDWYQGGVISKTNPDGSHFVWKANHSDESEKPYVRYVKLDKTAIDFIKSHSNNKYQIITSTRDPETEQQLSVHVMISLLKLIKGT